MQFINYQIIMSTTQNIGPIANKAHEKDTLFRESFVFVLDVIRFTELLEQEKKNKLAKQLFKAGTAFGEISNKARFIYQAKKFITEINKMYKNALNIKYLLQLCKYSSGYPTPNNLLLDLDLLIGQIIQVQETYKQ